MRRRKVAIRAVLACGTAAVTAAVVIAAISGSAGSGAGGGTSAQTAGYVIQRVERALASQDLVYRGQITADDGTTSTI